MPLGGRPGVQKGLRRAASHRDVRNNQATPTPKPLAEFAPSVSSPDFTRKQADIARCRLEDAQGKVALPVGDAAFFQESSQLPALRRSGGDVQLNARLPHVFMLP
jgi:hypothetical protein